jgi:hypothetical protein
MTPNMILNTKQWLFTIAFREKVYKVINTLRNAWLNAYIKEQNHRVV